ncbi:fragaceatoxin C [Rhizophagus irregularis]|nr:fragaceatoxin C [Rhizophagus irregularis]
MASIVLPIATITPNRLSAISNELVGDFARKTVITIKNHSKQILDEHSVHFYSGTSDWAIPGPVSNGEGLVWGTRKTAGPVATGTVGVFVYHVKDQNQSLAFMWSIPFDYNIYSNWWSIIVYDGFIEANDDLYREMYYNSPNKGDSQTYKRDLNSGWRYEGSMGNSGTPIIVVDIYKD